jgi:hypothetical protein
LISSNPKAGVFPVFKGVVVDELEQFLPVRWPLSVTINPDSLPEFAGISNEQNSSAFVLVI